MHHLWLKVIHSKYLVQVYDPQTSTHSRCLRWWCCSDSPGLQPSLFLACIGCFALTVILGKLNTLWVELDFGWPTRPVESITLFGLPCCGCVLRIVLLPMTHCSRSSDAFLWIRALSPSAMTSPPQCLTDEVCLGLWAGSIFSHFDLSITLAQVDLCLVCPKHFDPDFCSFPGALDANCNLAFSEGCILWRTCWGYTGIVLSWRLSLTHIYAYTEESLLDLLDSFKGAFLQTSVILLSSTTLVFSYPVGVFNFLVALQSCFNYAWVFVFLICVHALWCILPMMAHISWSTGGGCVAPT